MALDDFEERFATAVKAALGESRRSGTGENGLGEQAGQCPTYDSIAAYYESAGNGAERARLEKHFATCSRCQGTLAALLRMTPAIEAASETAGSATASPHHAAAEADSGSGERRFEFGPSWRVAGAAAAATLMVTALGVAGLHFYRDTISRGGNRTALLASADRNKKQAAQPPVIVSSPAAEELALNDKKLPPHAKATAGLIPESSRSAPVSASPIAAPTGAPSAGIAGPPGNENTAEPLPSDGSVPSEAGAPGEETPPAAAPPNAGQNETAPANADQAVAALGALAAAPATPSAENPPKTTVPPATTHPQEAREPSPGAINDKTGANAALANSSAVGSAGTAPATKNAPTPASRSSAQAFSAPPREENREVRQESARPIPAAPVQQQPDAAAPTPPRPNTPQAPNENAREPSAPSKAAPADKTHASLAAQRADRLADAQRKENLVRKAEAARKADLERRKAEEARRQAIREHKLELAKRQAQAKARTAIAGTDAHPSRTLTVPIGKPAPASEPERSLATSGGSIASSSGAQQAAGGSQGAAGASSLTANSSTSSNQMARVEPQVMNAPVIAAVKPGIPVAPHAVLVSTPDHSVYWSLQNSGIIYRTTDRKVWIPQTTGVDADLLAGMAPTRSVCWAVGRKGVILLTTDGSHWERIKSPTNADVIGIVAASKDVATIFTAGGVNYSTFDSGSNWEPAN